VNERKLSPEELISRGQRAQRILEDPLYVESFDAVERSIVYAWSNPNPLPADKDGRAQGWLTSPEIRDDLYRTLVALRKARALLTKFMQDGDLAAVRLETAQRAAEAADAGAGRTVT
jgi:hypothetical protein